ncbi:MAG: protocatechuate 3,4-dioxygenase subunit alpha [Pyrinomonadaceae bacterium]|nr:protocatechuate 3,4-dioxygenase subunit alpha [Pyrinomonadaceae bacterium]
MEKLRQTPSQTVGPFFAYSLTAEQYGYDYNSLINGLLMDNDTEGERIFITGNIYDGDGRTIPDAMVELWQADAQGHYRSLPINLKNDGFTGFGRLGTGTDAQHRFQFTTTKPGSVAGQAPHINVILFMRGSLRHLYTRLYFSDEAEANSKDELLKTIPEERLNTLIAQRKEYAGGTAYHFDMHMQGEKETIFFDVYSPGS